MEHMRPTARLATLAAGALTLLLALAACSRAPAAAAPEVIRYLSWTSSRGQFTVDLVGRLNAIPNVRVAVEETTGSLAVLSMLEQGRGDVGFAQADVTYVAYRRGLDPDLHPHKNLRGVAVRWVNSLSFLVPSDSAVRAVGDLRHKRVGIVPAGAAGELLTRIVLEAHGLTYADFQPVFVENDQMLGAIGSGALDAAVMPETPVSERGPAISHSRLRRIGITREIINKVRSNYPFIKRMVDPAAEAGDGGGIETVGVDSVLICRKDMSEALVYQLTKEFHALLTQIARAQPQALLDPEQASATPIPLHPGAARFYREREILR
jgi:TRAP transporter TAXI family solute receptor